MNTHTQNKPSYVMTAYLLILVALGYIATDIYLPSLPALTTYFNATENMVQMTLFSYMISFALVPLIFGPLSDHFGRKRIILLGIFIASLATIGCLFAGDIYSMIGFRFAQGIGTGAVIICSRAMLSDLYTGKVLAKQISYVTMFIPLVLAIAPTIGGVLQQEFGWSSVFIFLFCLMVGIFAWVLGRPETLKATSDKKISQVFSNYGLHIRNPLFFYQIMFVFPTIGLYAYLTTSPFLFQETIGLSPIEYGGLSIYIGATIMSTSFINTKLVHHFKIETLLLVGSIMILLSGLLLLLFHMMGILTTWSVIVPVMVFFTSIPLCIANSSSKAMGSVHSHFGSATALLSTLQFLSGAIGSFIFSNIEDNTALPLAICFILMGVLSVLHQIFSPKLQRN
jgi:DHA1 family 2-module integral membrane pump EmrD-like MFS transporter